MKALRTEAPKHFFVVAGPYQQSGFIDFVEVKKNFTKQLYELAKERHANVMNESLTVPTNSSFNLGNFFFRVSECNVLGTGGPKTYESVSG